MQQDILIIGVLFPAFVLMMVNFGNRYTVLANLIRHLHDEVIRENVSPNDTDRFLCKSAGYGTGFVLSALSKAAQRLPSCWRLEQ